MSREIGSNLSLLVRRSRERTRWTKTLDQISERRGEVVGEKDSVLAAVGRCSEMFLDQWRGCTTVTVCKLPPPSRMFIEYAKSLLRAPPIETSSRTDFYVHLNVLSTYTHTRTRVYNILIHVTCTRLITNILRSQLAKVAESSLVEVSY